MMKKIIALALALSMALSMVAFAGYTDAAKINEDLAADIELVGALGLMTGNPDGSFNPTGYLTRGEAAVIIYRLHSGKSTIDASWGDVALSTFSDMNHWSVAYVNYCAALGLIAGYTDGTFRPENNVTTVEMAKMLLNVAGYDTEKQGYGKNWPGAVLADASNAGLFDEYEAAFTATASREWVAKLVGNMIKNVNAVGYAYGDILTQTVPFGQKYGVASFTGKLTANDTEALGAASKSAKDTSVVGGNTIKADVATNLLGKEVKVYFKDADGDELCDATEKVYAVVDTTEKAYTTVLNKVTYKLNDKTEKYELTVDGVVVDEDVKNTPATFENLKAAALTLGAKDNRTVSVFFNAEEKVWNVMANKVEYAKVTEHKASNNQFQAGSLNLAGGTEDADKKAYAKVNFVDTIVKGDYVAIETVGNKAVSYNVSKLNGKTTKVGSYLPDAGKFVVAGTTYEKAAVVMNGFDYAEFLSTLGEKDALKETYDVYADGSFVIFAEKTPDNTSDATSAGLNMDIVYVIDSKKGTDAADAFSTAQKAKVQVLLTNGSIAIYDYVTPESKTAKKVALDADDAFNGGIYEYVLNEDGSIYFTQSVTAFEDTKSAFVGGALSGLTVNANVNKTVMTIDGKTVFANADSFLFTILTKDGKTKYSVVKVSELPAKAVTTGYGFGSVAAYTYDKTTGLYTLAYGVLTNAETDKLPVAPDAEATGDDYFVVTKVESAVVTENGTTWAVTGINNAGEKQSLNLTSKFVGADDKNGAVVAGKFYVVKSSDKELYLDACEAWSTKKVEASTGSAVLMDGKLADVKADANIVYYTLSDKGVVALADDLAVIPFGKNVLVKTDKNGAVTDMFIMLDKDGKMADVAGLSF